MMRVINVREALKTLCPDMQESFTLAVYGDQQIPQNNGAWRVSGNGVTDYVGTPDAEMDLLAFNQLICGALSLEGASYRCDIRVSANAGTLSKVFTVKPIFVTDRF